MFSRFIRIFCMIAWCGLVGVMGIYIGTGYTKNQIEKAEQKEERISYIAVVNLDEGVMSDDIKRYYAADLITFPNDNFKLASLEEARNGILNGTFGAYVIIPATFSESVESLNVTPMKSIIEYSINPNLADETRLVVEADIDTFWRNISERLSYTYVTSVMTEFHNVQDEAQIILDNDIEDMNNINAINPEELTESVEFSEMEIVEGELEYIDLSDTTEANLEYVQEIVDYYSEAQTKGEEQITGFSTGLETIQSSKEELDDMLLELNFMEDEDGNLVIQDEIDALEEELLLTQESRERCKEEINWLIKTNLYNQEKHYQTYINDELIDLQQSEQEKFNLWYEELKDSVTDTEIEWPEEFECLEDTSIDLSLDRVRESQDSDEQIPDLTDPALTEEEKQNIEIKSFAIEDALVERVESIDFVSDEVVRIIKEQIEPEVITLLTEGCASFEEKMQQVNTDITEYLAELTKYTPLENLDQEGLNESVQGLNENISSMQTLINEKTTEDMEYVANVYSTANENVNLLRNDMLTASDETENNVLAVITELKTNRENINTYNEEVLTGFVNKLPYTRVGGIENQQVYSYMVSPLSFEEITVAPLSA